MSTPRGWKRLAPGVYSDQDGTLHLAMSEMLAAAGYADTPENRDTLQKAALAAAVRIGAAFAEADEDQMEEFLAGGGTVRGWRHAGGTTPSLTPDEQRALLARERARMAQPDYRDSIEDPRDDEGLAPGGWAKSPT